MKLRFKKKTDKLFESVHRLYRLLYEFRKLILVLANDYEFLDLHYTQKLFFRKIVKNYDNVQNENDEDLNIVKKNIIPVLEGFTLNYVGNLSIAYISKINQLPYSKNIGVLKMIGPGEIEGNKLQAYEHLEYILTNFRNCKTESFYYFYDWNTKEKYNEFEHIFDAQIIDHKYKNKVADKDFVCISEFAYLEKHLKHNEIYSLPGKLFFISTALDMLKKGGNLFIYYTSSRYSSTVQLIYLLSTCFENFFFQKGEFYSSIGFYIFQNFKGVNIFESYLEDYLKFDNSLGSKYIFDEELNKDILFDFDIKITNEFYEKMKLINQTTINTLIPFIDKCRYIDKEVNAMGNRFIDKIINSNIERAINYAKKFNLKINPYYKNYFYKLTTTSYKKMLFPKANIDYNKIKLTYESTYSVTFPKEADQISLLIKKKYPNVKKIADMTANVGGNTLSFCKHFDFVYSIEIDKQTSEFLENNIKLYGYKNFKVLNMDSQKFNEKVDFYFYDPPWTGVLYKMNIVMDLYLGNNNIIDIMKPNFCLKAPLNYNVKDLVNKYNNLSIYKVKNFLIIINNI